MLSHGTDAETRLQRIADRARRDPTVTFDNLLSVLTVEYLADCFHALRKDAAVGVDEVSWADYSQQLDERLKELVERIHRMGYHPLPVRRVYIPKDGKSMRPLGIPAIEDKIFQEGLRRLLNTLFEPLFLDCSYGFRAWRGCHQALKELARGLTRQPVNYVIDADIKGFFDNVDHQKLLACIETRVKDRRVWRYLVRFLKAGVMEDGQLLAEQETGVPQGGVISPLLSNIFLHFVLDRWFVHEVRPQLHGFALLNRYADDFVLGIQHEDEARWLLEAVRLRLAKCGLTLAEGKTRLIIFSRYADDRALHSDLPVATFDYLGFTHYWTKTVHGKWSMRHRTSRKKFRLKVRAMKRWLQMNRHRLPLPELWERLKAKLRGHYAYYGVSFNIAGLQRFYECTRELIFKWLNRCSQRRRWNWERFSLYEKRYPLPRPRIVHDW
jgi:RNA-directed DNA polymerase